MNVRAWLLVLAIAALAGCGDDGGEPVDAGTRDAGWDGATAQDAGDDAGDDAGGDDGGSDGGAGSSDASGFDAGPAEDCRDSREVGERYPAGDDCNFCVCQADGTASCTERTCVPDRNGCTYNGARHGYGERFSSTDGCNECVCAASGLACTRRSCDGALEEGAILVESLDEPCGDIRSFTARRVLESLPRTEFTAPFLYERDREDIHYPETAPDSTTTVRIVYDGGFAVCRIPNPGQEAFDIEVLLEQTTADGAFDEGFRTYLRRNAGGFADVWTTVAAANPGELNGTYDPRCLDARGFTFGVTIEADGSAGGAIHKACETDLSFVVGAFIVPPL